MNTPTIADLTTNVATRSEVLALHRQVAQQTAALDSTMQRLQKMTGHRDKWKREAYAFRERLKVIDEEFGARFCGCYILVLCAQPIYVGQSVNVFGRIASHRGPQSYPTAGKFDEVRIVWCDIDQLDAVEAKLIAALQPPLNRAGVTGRHMSRLAHNRTNIEPGAGAPA